MDPLMVLLLGCLLGLAGVGLMGTAAAKNIRAHGWGKADLFWKPGRPWFVAGLLVGVADLIFIFSTL